MAASPLADNDEGKKLNSPNGVVVKSDNTVWFTDPTYGIMGDHEGGWRGTSELPRNVYRFDPQNNKLTVAVGGFNQPNAICFSPDDKQLYISDTSGLPSNIRVFDVDDDGTLTNGCVFHDFAATYGGLGDDLSVDEDGNLWCAGGWAADKNFNG